MTPARPRPLQVLVAAAAVVLTAAGCGGGSSYQSSGTNAKPAARPTRHVANPKKPAVTVSEREFSLSPSHANVAKTGTITIGVKNAGTIQHALEVDGPSGPVRTAAIAPGGSDSLRVVLNKPGRYQWFCPIDGHRGRGMIGTIVVAGGGTSAPSGKSSAKKHGSKSGSGSSGGTHGSGGGTDKKSGGVSPPSSNSPSDGSHYPG